MRAGQAVAKSAGAIYSDNMGQQDFIAVDWGTTNRRAYRIRAGAVIGALLHKAKDDDEQTSSRWNFGSWLSQRESGAWIRRRF